MAFFTLVGTSFIYIILALYVYSVVLDSITKGKRYVLLNKQWFVVLSVSQLLAILFNVGDCGANGSFNSLKESWESMGVTYVMKLSWGI